MRKYGKLVFTVVVTVAVLMASPTISYGRTNGNLSLGASSFASQTSDSVSEQEKAALLAQIDATDSGYNRSSAENGKANNQNRTQAWLDSGEYGKNLLICGWDGTHYNCYTGTFRDFSMTNTSATTTTTQPTQTTQPSTQPNNTGSSGNSSSGSAQPAPQPSTQPTQSVDYFYADYDMGFAKEKCSLTDGHIFNFTVARSGYTFLGWYDEDGNQVTSLSPDLAGKTLTAHWREDCFYLDFGMGGSVVKNRLDDPFPFQNVTARPGYVFVGWYDEDGNRVTSLSDDLAGKTLTARWEEA